VPTPTACWRERWPSGANLRRAWGEYLCISLDETTTRADLALLWDVFAPAARPLPTVEALRKGIEPMIPHGLRRSSAFLTHPVFNTHHSETEMLRYIRSLSDKDLALDRSMIPLGSCTMKLNATSEMIPITWPEFANIHPFAPGRPAGRLRAAQRAAVQLAVPGHRLRRHQPAAQRRLAG
jgi:glycine dehydrogenase